MKSFVDAQQDLRRLAAAPVDSPDMEELDFLENRLVGAAFSPQTWSCLAALLKHIDAPCSLGGRWPVRQPAAAGRRLPGPRLAFDLTRPRPFVERSRRSGPKLQRSQPAGAPKGDDAENKGGHKRRDLVNIKIGNFDVCGAIACFHV